MGYIGTIMADGRQKEEKTRVFFRRWLPLAGLGKPPKGFFKKRCPLCESTLNWESHFTPYGGFSLGKWQCENPGCDYVYIKQGDSD